MEWVNNLYTETKRIWKENGEDKNGYAIFYSPPVFNPDIMIVGYNPGGGENSFDESKASIIPKEHDYFPQKESDDYPMAKKMRKIFENAGMREKLKKSVKFNLIFFRSRSSKELKTPESLINFSEDKTKEIVDKLKPKLILAEGFKTYDKLIRLTNVKDEKNDKFYSKNKSGKKRRIIRIGNANDIKVIGIIHPSGGYGISDDILIEIGKNLKEELNN